ncbi:MAG: divalent-cation tolerance protein CutA [Halobacteriales archaeon]|nr:divalent-cation tolerance protein CutA [Halobacteriales archaeon]
MAVSVDCTAGSPEEARRVAQHVLGKRLAACANLWPIESHSWWDGKLEQAQETAMLLKTRSALLPQLVAAIEEVHTYSVPCVVAWPIEGGSDAYLDWVEREARGKEEP